jgi:hypothetical protein
MDNNQRLQLQKLIGENDVVETTGLMRELKHSSLIRADVNAMQTLKLKYPRLPISNPNEFDRMCISKCGFLFEHYTDIYNKVKKDEINLDTLSKFLDVLKEIENGTLDQHEGSFKVGNLLKTLYIDSAVKKADKLEANRKNKAKSKHAKPDRKISWSEFKATKLNNNDTKL